MRVTTSLSTLLYGYASFLQVSALSLPALVADPLEGKSMPHYMSHIDITRDVGDYDGENATHTLVPRRNIDYCIRDPARSGVCVALGGAFSAVVFGIATLAKSSSSNNDCKLHQGQVDNTVYSYYAKGDNCDTTAELKTIAGAMANYFRDQKSNVCGTHCIKMTHGGTWEGYVSDLPRFLLSCTVLLLPRADGRHDSIHPVDFTKSGTLNSPPLRESLYFRPTNNMPDIETC